MKRNGSAHAHVHPEEGFTLIELLIVIAILPLIVGAISVALLTSINQQTTIAAKTSDTGDATLVSANFIKDVQSATSITTANPAPTNPYPCGTHTPPILSLYWGTAPTEVSYDVLQQGGTGKWDLYRFFCESASDSGPGTVTSSTILAYNVQQGLSASIAGLSCLPAHCVDAATAAGQGWTSTAGIQGVTFGVSSSEPNGVTYHYTLTGAPRTTNNASGGGQTPPSPPPLLLTGTSGTAVTCNGGGTLRVDGIAQLDTTFNPALQVKGTTGGVTATSIYTDAPNSPNPLSGHSGTVTPSSPSGPPISTPDPFQGLTLSASATSGLPTYPAGTALANPGIYSGQVKVNGPTTITNGVYVFEAGLDEEGTGTITGAGGAAADVLFYITGGTFKLAGSGNDDLSPISSPPSPTPGLVIWQDVQDTNTFSIIGSGTSVVLGGIVYAPGASSVSIGGSGGMQIGSLVSGGKLTCSGGGSVQIG